MNSTLWAETPILINGKISLAIAPVIISASRATDIPAFYAIQFINCLRKGYLYWTNPFNGKKSLISLKQTKLIVFWTKNPAPLLPYLEEIRQMGIDFYFNYTLNDYVKEGFEKHLPNLESRIDNFIKLSANVGKENIIWRFDPVILNHHHSIDLVIEKIEKLAQKLHKYTDQLVFSFVDTNYKKVQRKFKKNNTELFELFSEDKKLFASKLSTINKDYSLRISTCAESLDLSQFGISPNKCIDNKLIVKNFPHNYDIKKFLERLVVTNQLKDKGQRKYCSCIPSKDIGRYNSCGYSCLYCYAMHETSALKDDIFN